MNTIEITRDNVDEIKGILGVRRTSTIKPIDRDAMRKALEDATAEIIADIQTRKAA